MKKAEPFYSAYNKKLMLFYKLKNEVKDSTRDKLRKDLTKIDKYCEEEEKYIEDDTGRVIVVFQSLEVR